MGYMLNPTPPPAIKRKRRLTLPFPVEPRPGSWKSSLRSLSRSFQKRTPPHPLAQTQSPLLKLPAEIRRLIWEFVVCGGAKGRVAIAWRADAQEPPVRGEIVSGWRGVYVKRPGPAPSFSSRLFSERPPYNAGRPRALQDRDVDKEATQAAQGTQSIWGLGVLGLLQSCRAVYSEVIPLLYATPTFHFHFGDVMVFLAFVGCVLPQRRNQIRHVHFTFDEGKCTYGPPLDARLHYGRRMQWLEMRSELPDGAVVARGEPRAVISRRWAVDTVVRGMEGLEGGTLLGWERGECVLANETA